jgi:hypothetical protein
MKRINLVIIAALAASLILVAGCYEGGVTQPPVPGYDGFIADGWIDFEAGDYTSAMVHFQAAIDMDVSKPQGYLGAGWCSVLLPDYWVIGDQYDYMALQLDGGTWPVVFATEEQTQDLSWSVFECVSPALTADDYLVINSFGTTDTLIVGGTVVFAPDPDKPAMDNQEIGAWLYAQYGAVRFQYTFEVDDPNVVALFSVANSFSNVDASVDSIVNGAAASTVYLSVPHFLVAAGGNYRTWCMNQNIMLYEYATYNPAGGATTIANDAAAAFGLLQNARGENGNIYYGVASLLGLANEVDYSFSHYAGITSLKLKGMAAAMAYSNQYFRFALGVCRSAGYALDVEVADPNFLVELMQEIELMLQ